MKKFVGLRAKIYSYLKDNDDEHSKIDKKGCYKNKSSVQRL